MNVTFSHTSRKTAMNYNGVYITFIFCFFLLFHRYATAQSTEAAELAPNGDNDESDHRVPQCVCSELDACMTAQRQGTQPCVEQCTVKLTHPQWQEAAGRQCFVENAKSVMQPSTCMQIMRRNTCANEPGMTLNRPETRRPHDHFGRHSGQEDGPGHRFGFRVFLESTFGESGVKYKKCIHKCFRGAHSNCHRQLKCSTRRPTPEELRLVLAKCAPNVTMQERHATLCECLQKAGIRNMESCSNAGGEAAKNSVN